MAWPLNEERNGVRSLRSTNFFTASLGKRGDGTGVGAATNFTERVCMRQILVALFLGEKNVRPAYVHSDGFQPDSSFWTGTCDGDREK